MKNKIFSFVVAKEVIGQSDHQVQFYEKYLEQLKDSIGKMPQGV